jgi:hypothetical protein
MAEAFARAGRLSPDRLDVPPTGDELLQQVQARTAQARPEPAPGPVPVQKFNGAQEVSAAKAEGRAEIPLPEKGTPIRIGVHDTRALGRDELPENGPTSSRRMTG